MRVQLHHSFGNSEVPYTAKVPAQNHIDRIPRLWCHTGKIDAVLVFVIQIVVQRDGLLENVFGECQGGIRGHDVNLFVGTEELRPECLAHRIRLPGVHLRSKDRVLPKKKTMPQQSRTAHAAITQKPLLEAIFHLPTLIEIVGDSSSSRLFVTGEKVSSAS